MHQIPHVVKRFYPLAIAIAFSIVLFSFSTESVAQCNIPTAKSSTTPPSSFDYETISDGNWTSSSTWKNGSKPSTSPSGKKIKITHDVTVQNSDIILKSGAILYVYDGKLTLENGNLKLDDAKNEKFLAVESYIEVSGNVQQKNNTVFYCKNVDLQVGDEGDDNGDPLFASGGSTTSADFQNDGGYRRLEDVCLIVTHDYDNTGEDELINVCAEIGIRQPLNSSSPVGQGSGNLSNYSSATSMKIYGSQFFLPNGNVQNSKVMTTCATAFKLTNGNFQNQSSSTWSGDSLCIWVTGSSNHDLQNSGTWNVTVTGLCINGQIQGTYNTALPSENCSTIANCFDSNCCDPTPVPVTWLSVEALSIGPSLNKVSWSTAQEIDNQYFTVERSTDGRLYKAIGNADGAGNSTDVREYEMYDADAPTGTAYYRVKQTDFSGEFEYSQVVVVVGSSTPMVELQPNPANDILSVNWSNAAKADAIRVIDLRGVQVYNTSIEPGQNNIELNIQNLDEGVYILEILEGSDAVNRSRFILKH